MNTLTYRGGSEWTLELDLLCAGGRIGRLTQILPAACDPEAPGLLVELGTLAHPIANRAGVAGAIRVLDQDGTLLGLLRDG